ncbi:MAG TPA: hypothetical protein HPP87_11795 [Planctomycetes bacterium]|nr:hypothetical protein [Planctomycetota bacterium]HIJ72026.1 hypothetical protein [Planctomycetota bacterium]
MVRKRTKRKKKPARQWFGLGPEPATRKKTRSTKAGPGRRIALIVFAMICILAVVATGFVFLDRYVQRITASGRVGPLQLVDRPGWFNNELGQKVYAAAGGSEFALNETVARAVADNLESIAWLYDVKVQATVERVEVRAQYRRPIAMIRLSGQAFYIDRDSVLLPFVPIEDLIIVEVRGYSSGAVPPVGEPMTGDDIDAAIKLLTVLERMDEISTPRAPLLGEVASIDVSNLDGRKSRNRPHIVINAKDGTQINWGAAYGRSARHIEASDQEKVAMLYEFYKQHGTIQCITNGLAKYIELRNPQEAVPRPTAP